MHARRALYELRNISSSSFCRPTPFIHLGDKSIWMYASMHVSTQLWRSVFFLRALLSELHDLNFTHASLLRSHGATHRLKCPMACQTRKCFFESSLSMTPVKGVEDRRSSWIIGTLGLWQDALHSKAKANTCSCRGGCDEHRYNTCRRHLDTGLLGEKFKLIGD